MGRVTEKGRIVKITKFGFAKDGDIIHGSPMWGVVEGRDRDDKTPMIEVLVCTEAQQDAITHYGGALDSWTLVNSLDEWRAIPDKYVPDHVWAALAKRRLLSSVTSENE